MIGNGLGLIPPLGKVLAGNALFQAQGVAEITADSYMNGLKATSPEMLELMNEITLQNKETYDRMDLDHLKLDLGRLGYDYAMGGQGLQESLTAIINDPTNFSNYQNFSSKMFLKSNPAMAATMFGYDMIVDSDYRQTMIQDGLAVANDTGNFFAGANEYGRSRVERIQVEIISGKSRALEVLPLSEAYEARQQEYYLKQLDLIASRDRFYEFLPEPRAY